MYKAHVKGECLALCVCVMINRSTSRRVIFKAVNNVQEQNFFMWLYTVACHNSACLKSHTKNKLKMLKEIINFTV